MLVSEAFPSKYLGASDLDEDVRGTITAVAPCDDPKIQKPALYVKEFTKPLLLNKTNATAISSVYGDDTMGWLGRPVIFFVASATNPAGQTVPAVRVRVPKTKPPAAGVDRTKLPPPSSPSPSPAPNGASDIDIDDDIPF